MGSVLLTAIMRQFNVLIRFRVNVKEEMVFSSRSAQCLTRTHHPESSDPLHSALLTDVAAAAALHPKVQTSETVLKI